jgi:hypothetical protein
VRTFCATSSSVENQTTSTIKDYSYQKPPLLSSLEEYMIHEKLDTAKDKWKGYGEYPIWNEVPTNTIACTLLKVLFLELW